MQTLIHQIIRREFVRNGFWSWCSFRLFQVDIKITVHQELAPISLIPDGHYTVLYGRDISGSNILNHNIPPPPPFHQLEADDIQTVEAKLLNEKVLRLVVENYSAAAMSTRCRHCRHPRSAWLPCVNHFYKIGLLHNSTINLSLHQPVKRRLQSSVPSAPDDVRAKYHHFLRPLSVPPPLLVMHLDRFAHPIPSENIFSYPVWSPLVPSLRLFYLPLRPLRHSYAQLARMTAPPFRYY